MTRKEFIKLINELDDIYGVSSYKDNLTPDITEDDVMDDLWFECPECGDIVYYEDCDFDECLAVEGKFICPVCEEELERY